MSSKPGPSTEKVMKTTRKSGRVNKPIPKLSSIVQVSMQAQEAIELRKKTEAMLKAKSKEKMKLQVASAIEVSDVATPVNLEETSTTDTIVTTTPRAETSTINILRPRINLFRPPSEEPEKYI